MNSQGVVEPRSPFECRAFVRFWIGRVGSVLAYQMIAVAVGWQMYAITGSALALGLVGLVQFLPSLVLVLVVGHVADRYDRRRIVGACLCAEAVAAGLIATLGAQGLVTEFALYALVAAIGTARAFEMSATQAMVPSLVPERLLSRAIGAQSSATQTAIVIGPALGGFLYVAGPVVVYGLCAAFLATAALLIGGIAIAARGNEREPPSLTSLFAGIRYVRRKPALFGAISLDMVAVLLGGATALLPIYASDILHTGAWGLGLLRSAPALGALATAIWLAHHPLRRQAGRRMFRAVGVFGLATIVFGFSQSFVLSFAALLVLGAADMVSVVVRQSLVQLGTPDAMRGRVAAVNSMFIGASNQLGEFESGLVAAWLGAVPSVVLGGFGTLGIVLLWRRWFPALERVDSLDARQLRESNGPAA